MPGSKQFSGHRKTGVAKTPKIENSKKIKIILDNKNPVYYSCRVRRKYFIFLMRRGFIFKRGGAYP
jgi:hypothetical protein